MMSNNSSQVEEIKKHFHSKTGMALKTLLVLFLVLYLGTLIRNEWKEFNYIGKSEEFPHIISISGEGKVVAIPDIAKTSVGIRTEKLNVANAQTENTTKMNALIKEIKGMGVDDKDIQTTSYNIYPRYDWRDGISILRGYSVEQSVTIKIRDLEKIGDILTAAGQGGANQVSGISFDVDDPEALRQQAREEAIKNAKEKAESLAKVAGVKLGKVVSFSESTSGQAPKYYAMEAMDAGIGGGSGVPEIEAGSMEIIITATVGYEIL
ncbi:SIMPL domain-containing protein [Patescibacteria group bacterium]|nr:SIMPL domain-containing protein [Patescibacteria group bacterium]